jgi:CRP-like cAMP-binding protein
MDARSLAGPVIDTEVPTGTELVPEGAVIGTFFLIRSGSAHLFCGDCAVEALGTGDCFGEVDPLSCEPQRYTVIATSTLRLMAFSAVGISRLCDAIPGTREGILNSLPSRGAEIHPLPRPTSGNAGAGLAVLDAAAV